MYDTIAIYIYDIPYKQLYAHHVICFGIFTITALSTHGGALFTYSFIICELSGPLQNARDFMKTFGYKDTQAYAVLEMVFIFSFILLRGVIYTTYGIPDLIRFFFLDLPVASRYGICITFLGIWIWSLWIIW